MKVAETDDLMFLRHCIKSSNEALAAMV